MVQIGGAPGHDSVPIGDVSAPPFAVAPDPSRIFEIRAERFRWLADGHELDPYLRFLAGVCDIQHRLQVGLGEPALPSPEERLRSREFGMPALDRNRFLDDPVCRETVRRFVAEAAALDMPAPARQALERVAALDATALGWMMQAVLDDTIPFGEVAEHVVVAAGLQVHAARAAAHLDAAQLVPVGEGVCPACGGAPVASVVVGWQGAHGARFCSCSLCGTLWNHVRIRCTACGSTKGIGYQEVDGTPGSIKAETCSECRSYLKVLYQMNDPALEPVADDVASSALDLLVGETGIPAQRLEPFPARLLIPHHG